MPCLGWGTLNAAFADFLNLGTLGVFLFLLVKHRQERVDDWNKPCCR